MGNLLIDIKEYVVTTLGSEKKNYFESEDDTGKLFG